MKSWYKSKTVWFGVAQLAFGAIGYFTGWMEPAQATTLVITGFGAIGLRVKTRTEISG